MRAKTKHYNETTEFYVNELPRSCSEDDCPFNYDTNSCSIVNEDSISEEQYEEPRVRFMEKTSSTTERVVVR